MLKELRLGERETIGLRHPTLIKSRLVTIGAPRVGNRYFVKFAQALFNRYNVDVHRIVHNRDIVPHLPPYFMGYRHLARDTWIDGRHGHKYADTNATATNASMLETFLCHEMRGDDRACSFGLYGWKLNAENHLSIPTWDISLGLNGCNP